jgi:adenylate cyclase
LELPGFRDNLDTRLVMLKRRLDERQSPVRIERTGRGRFRLHVITSMRLESHD